jgi:hypothetical protein
MAQQENGSETMLADDEEVGEQVETPYFSVADSEIRPGDGIIFRLRRSALLSLRDDLLDRALAATKGQAALLGEVLDVLAGHEMCYVVKILSKANPQLARRPLIVPKADVLMVKTASELADAVSKRAQEDEADDEED